MLEIEPDYLNRVASAANSVQRLLVGRSGHREGQRVGTALRQVCHAVMTGVLISGCGAPDSSQGAWSAVQDFGDVFRQLTHLRLEADSGDPIGRVSEIVVWRGQYVVLDEIQANLKVFDSAGHLVRTIGRVGEGPGEFRQPFRAAVMADGRLAVLDRPRVYVSVFSWPGTFSHGWKVPGIQPGGITAVGESLLVAVRIVGDNGDPDPEGVTGAVQVYGADGTVLGRLMRIQPPSGPYRYTLGGQFFTRVGRVLLLAAMDTNAVRFYDLDRRAEWTEPVSEATYEAPAYPKGRLATIEAFSQWARSQWWMTNVIGIGDVRFIGRFSTIADDGTELHRYAVGTAGGQDLVATRATPINVVGASGDTIIAASEFLAGGAEMILFQLRPTFEQ